MLLLIILDLFHLIAFANTNNKVKNNRAIGPPPENIKCKYKIFDLCSIKKIRFSIAISRKKETIEK